MPDFQSLFDESKGEPVQYKGRKIYESDRFPVKNGDKIVITFEKTNSEWRQGILLEIQGNFEIEGELIKKMTIFWENTAPKHIELSLHLEKTCKTVTVKNAWDPGNGGMFSCYYGSAMIIEEIENGRRYYCNDGHPDENFDDIVFTIQKISPK